MTTSTALDAFWLVSVEFGELIDGLRGDVALRKANVVLPSEDIAALCSGLGQRRDELDRAHGSAVLIGELPPPCPHVAGTLPLGRIIDDVDPLLAPDEDKGAARRACRLGGDGGEHRHECDGDTRQAHDCVPSAGR